MKNIITLCTFLWICLAAFGQSKKEETPYRILLAGASFASPENGWFERGCRELNATPINKAIPGEAIAHTANRMAEGTWYTREELETLDALVIMHVHEKNVLDESQILENYTDYKLPFDRSNYAAAFDFVIKRYTSDCYELKNNPASRYYQSKSGKPVVIVLCTDWHDARIVYNGSVRRLCEKWGFPLVEFDKNIGFSKNQVHPVTKEQYSLVFSMDTQIINGVTYGWHPVRGENAYIQQRMAAIFVETMKKIGPIK